jgi:D-alanyl-D-alanine carboxypeptidase
MTDMAACAVSDPLSYTVIVNKKHCFDPIEWEPDDLVQAEGYYLRTQAADRLIAMMTAAAAADNTFSLSSAYRSYQGQAVTYDTWVAVNGSEASADAVSARPGFSEHQTGLAVDLMLDDCVLECFGTTPQYTWLVAHAAEYGFIQRYPEGLTSITGYETESWHWRYVGIHTATRMKSLGVQTLEAYFDVTGGNYE